MKTPKFRAGDTAGTFTIDAVLDRRERNYAVYKATCTQCGTQDEVPTWRLGQCNNCLATRKEERDRESLAKRTHQALNMYAQGWCVDDIVRHIRRRHTRVKQILDKARKRLQAERVLEKATAEQLRTAVGVLDDKERLRVLLNLKLQQE